MRDGKVLPPVYFLGALGGAVMLHYVVPFVAVIPRPWHLAGGVLVAVGLAFIVLPARTFQTKGTAIKPFERSSVLITDGFYAITRNPMYLGMVLVVTGVATLLRGAAPFFVPVLLAALLQSRFIRFEERALAQVFGDDYRSYQARVRRWL